MAQQEDGTPEYRRGYYEGFLRGAREARFLGPNDLLPQEIEELAIRLHLYAIANRDDASTIEAPPISNLPPQAPLSTENRHLPEALDPPAHWSEKYD